MGGRRIRDTGCRPFGLPMELRVSIMRPTDEVMVGTNFVWFLFRNRMTRSPNRIGKGVITSPNDAIA